MCTRLFDFSPKLQFGVLKRSLGNFLAVFFFSSLLRDWQHLMTSLFYSFTRICFLFLHFVNLWYLVLNHLVEQRLSLRLMLWWMWETILRFSTCPNQATNASLSSLTMCLWNCICGVLSVILSKWLIALEIYKERRTKELRFCLFYIKSTLHLMPTVNGRIAPSVPYSSLLFDIFIGI